MTAETFNFKSEARQLLDLMIHSLYSNKEIFLRELISNSSDAIDKLRIESLTDATLLPADHVFEIRVEADEEARTLTISDSGVGMSREEVIKNLGTIAHSGTKAFVGKLKEAQTEAQQQALIGQFGVGFYSSFMVAQDITVISRRAGEESAICWRSTGDGTFSIEEATRDTIGTSITLHLREADEENELADYTQEWPLRSTIKKYSDYVQHPILLKVAREDQPVDEEGKPVEGAEPIKRVEWEQVNSMKAIWTRPQSEVEASDYNDFYRHVARDWKDPLDVISFRAEGTFEYYALLFIPEQRPHDLFYRNAEYGLQLYVNRVLVLEQAQDLVPDYLRFVKGVIDSPDLSLNVSREILQKDRRVKQIRTRITKKVLDALNKLREDSPEKYSTFWQAFGGLVKEGVTSEQKYSAQLHKLLWFTSSTTSESLDKPEGYTTLEGYVERMKEDQDAIYYITGDSRQAVANSPHLEAFTERGYEVLFLTDPIDEIMLSALNEFDEKPLKSVGKGNIELGSDEEKKQAEEDRAEKEKTYASLLEYIQKQLDDHVKEVRLSNRLKSSPVCLVNEENQMSPHLERILKQAGQDQLPTQKRILEINPNHAILTQMQGLFDKDATSGVLTDYAHLLHGQALLAEGSSLPDPVAFSQRVATLMVRTPN